MSLMPFYSVLFPLSPMSKSTPKATHQGDLPIAGIKIPAAVLEDGTRLLTQRGVFVALGRHKNPSTGQAAIDNRPAFLAAKNLEPFITDELRQLWAVVKFKPLKGGGVGGNIAYGYKAEILPHLCSLFLDAKDAGALLPSQVHIAKQCGILLRGFAHVGIVALVDEATGYQEVRARDELGKILAKYISKELLPWAKRFPNEFYQEIFRLNGWPYDPASVKRPSVVGKMTKELIYEQLPPGVIAELEKKNPKNEKGHRDFHHHRFLTDDIGNPHLEKQIVAVTTLMRASPNKGVFMRMFKRAFPRAGQQDELPLDDLETA